MGQAPRKLLEVKTVGYSHQYVGKKYAGMRSDIERDQVRLICTGRWVDYDPMKHVTVPTGVDCPACLEILIPIAESRLKLMQANYLRTKPAVGGQS